MSSISLAKPNLAGQIYLCTYYTLPIEFAEDHECPDIFSPYHISTAIKLYYSGRACIYTYMYVYVHMYIAVL